MIAKVSFLVAASFAAFAVSQLNKSFTMKKNVIFELQDGASLESEKVEEKEEESANSDVPEEDKENRRLRSCRMFKNVTEVEKSILIRDLASEIEQRKVNLQGKLLELYGLKEERQYLAKLETHLEEKSVEIGKLNVTLASLQAEKESLEEETKQGALAKKKLEMAKNMIVEMEKTITMTAIRMKGRVSMIDERVCGIRWDENSASEDLIEQKVKAVCSSELEVGKTKRRNKELELEKRALTVKLLVAQDKIASLSQVTEDEVIDKIADEKSALRHSNDDLSREIENLHKDRFGMLEELMYQRWLNICLRYEAENKDSEPKQSFKNNNLNNHNALTNSEEKINSPTLYPSSSYSSTSLASSTESDQIETTTFGSSSTESSQNSSTKSSGFLRRMTRWSSGCKNDSIVTPMAQKRRNLTSKAGLVRRFSTSMVLDNLTLMRKNKGLDENVIKTTPCVENKEQYCSSKSSVKSSCNTRRVRRVSFSDHLVRKISYDDDDVTSLRSVDRVLGHRRSDEKSIYRPNTTTGFEGKEKSEEKSEILNGVNGGVSNNDQRLENIDGDVLKNEIIGGRGSKENIVDDVGLVQHLYALLGFLLFILLAYVLHATTKFFKN